MREIKFRAWEPLVRSFVPLDGFCVANNGVALVWESIEPRKLVKHSGLILMQYTGLKDKNGVEIYEGDIVKAIAPDDHTDHNCISDVTRDITDTSWCVRSRPDGDMEYEHGLNLLWWESLEIIGNIYENPELLT